IYALIMVPASNNPTFSFIRITVYSIQLLPLISIIIQSQIYFGNNALTYISMSLIKFTGVLFFIPLYSFISIPHKTTGNIMMHKRFLISGGLLHPVAYTSLLLILFFAILSFPKNTNEHLQRQFKKWRFFAFALIGFHLFMAMSRGPIVGFFIGVCAFATFKYMHKNGLNLEVILLTLFGSLSLLILLSLIASDIIPLQEVLRSMMREEVRGEIGLKEITTGRTDIWIYIFENVSPFTSIFGNGFGLMDADNKWHDQDNEMHLNGAHNAYLMSFAMCGFIGFSLMFLYFFQCILMIQRSSRFAEEKQTGLYILFFVHYAIDSLTTSNIGPGLTINTAFFLLLFSLPIIPKKRRNGRTSSTEEKYNKNTYYDRQDTYSTSLQH
ncbi:MAG: hypothetical protein CL916_14025, partial [Deltaproteobacteria bacterium]|nr:hypothetical protein [Deltaproteobacteria bacterium]